MRSGKGKKRFYDFYEEKTNVKKPVILVAVVGVTPQVVTETLYALLVGEKENVTNLEIITTAEGKKTMQTLKFEENLSRMCERFRVRKPMFDFQENVHVAKEESFEMSDIRTSQDNLLFPNFIINFIRSKTADPDSHLNCSIAGGRKTMSVAMAIALSLFGRKDDRLSHVLVSKEFETSKKFFPDTRREGKQIVLADVPFLRLREKLSLLKDYPTASFTKLVELSQREIDELLSIPHLIIERRLRRLTIGQASITLPPFEFAVYTFFLKQKDFIEGGKKYGKEHAETLLALYQEYATSDENIRRVRSTVKRGEAYDFTAVQKAIAQIKHRIKSVLGNTPQTEHYVISTRGAYGSKQYGILLDKSKIRWK